MGSHFLFSTLQFLFFKTMADVVYYTESSTASKELGKEVLWFRVHSFLKIGHNMSFLLPSLDCLNKFHLAFDNHHVNNSDIFDLSVLLEFFSELGSTLGLILGDVILHH